MKGDIVIPAGTEPRLLCDRSPMRGSHGAEVVVIGAGLSGLYAARLLAAKGVDVSGSTEPRRRSHTDAAN